MQNTTNASGTSGEGTTVGNGEPPMLGRRAFLRGALGTIQSGDPVTAAARFLRLIVQHVQTASLSDLRKADLTSAGHAALAVH